MGTFLYDIESLVKVSASGLEVRVDVEEMVCALLKDEGPRTGFSLRSFEPEAAEPPDLERVKGKHIGGGGGAMVAGGK